MYTLFFIFKPKHKVKLLPKHNIIIWTISFIILINYLYQKVWRLYFWMLGRGIVHLLEPKGENHFSDGGGYINREDDSNIGDDIVIPFLLDYGVTK